MNEAEIRQKLAELEIERRSFMESVKNGTGEFNADEATKKLADIESRKAQLEKQFAELQKPAGKESRAAGNGFTAEDFLKAAEEKRTITIGTNGQINQVKNLVETVQEPDTLVDAVTFDYGPNASTNIPVLEPGLDEPGDYDEGTNAVAEDENATLTTTEIQPKAYASVLPVTAEQIQMGVVDITSKLPELFAKVFKRKMHRGLLTGDGQSKRMKGIFVSAAEDNAHLTEIAGTSIKISELAGLALQVIGLDETYQIVMNSAVYQAILADSTSGEDIKIYKEGLIRDKSIEGVKIVIDNKAPTSTAAGSVLAVAVPLSRYHVGVAGTVNVTPIKVKGDTKTYFQAEAFFSGKQVTDSDIYSLAVAEA